MSLLVAEWFSVIGDEVELVWPSKRTIMKYLYILSRYGPFIDTPLNVIYYLQLHITPQTCLLNYRVSSSSTFIGIVVAENILVARTIALYGHSRRVFIALVTLSVLNCILGSVVMYFFLSSLAFGPQSPPLPGCNMVRGSSIVFVNFVILVVWELVIVSMTAYKALNHLRASRTPLIQTLYRDGACLGQGLKYLRVSLTDLPIPDPGAVTFCCLLVLSIGNIINFTIVPPEYLDLLDTLTRVLHSIVCCRVVLNIRKAARKEVITTARTSLPSLRFWSRKGQNGDMESRGATDSVPLSDLSSCIDRRAE
ncbi:hypothetical protein GLOTRDRAFT_128814 [Gloeophyllum trabeum ATCC 11539]|uniref:DUF6533 domain-containing protein n=1 Tax=Gloeophyllum trabeum (strain ATCC 11539 / FP-39264 / Madison 617) TaxID=670483 RepID=S7Q6A3_GLOTA|nr:uncharacterized protein GLOTRDRAFT_128814 [Gloeophyllum trabeum ATCC 11539]EPQ55591.1 hypothetical protein GLOTRDRAFT_128814 [Gloeophyllum trabeum ATCC 11539]